MASQLGFYSWIERGLGAFLTEGSDASGLGPRARLRVALSERRTNGSVNSASADVDLDLMTPGHIAGIDAGMVTRVWPKHGASDAETDYFAHVEFADADFPWRYSPVRGVDIPGGVSGRAPWIALVVLAEDEVSYAPASASQSLPSIIVAAGADGLPLPPIDELFLWAHGQLSGGSAGSAQALRQILDTHPERGISRLVCPRYLASNTGYRAFLVPTYKAGADVILGRSASGVYAPAWTAEDATVELPVYCEWSFRTGPLGSFYDLARRLVPRRLLSGSGRRTMDVSRPGLAALAGKATEVEVGGALRPVDAGDFAWPEPERTAWREALAPIVNQPQLLLDEAAAEPPAKPTLAPPLYGQWQAGVAKIDRAAGGEAPPWFQELNETPQTRVPAALGTAAVQNNQQALLASAWEQVEGLVEINQRLRQAQLGREGSLQAYRRHLAVIDRPGPVLQFASSIHGRAKSGGGRTVLGALVRSPIPDGIVDPAWRRLTRPRGRLGFRQRRPDLPRPEAGRDILDDLNEGTLDPAPPPPTPSGAGTPATVGANQCPHCLTPEIVDAVAAHPEQSVLYWGLVSFRAGQLFAAFGGYWRVGLLLMRIGLLFVEAAATPGGLDALRRRVRLLCAEALEPEEVDTAPPVGDGWDPVEPVPDDPGNPPSPDGGTIGEDEREFRDAIKAVLEVLGAEPKPGLVLEKADLPQLAKDILATLDPRSTIGEALARRLETEEPWNPTDPLEPLIVGPQFPQPLYEPLRDQSLEWILPRANEVRANTLALVQTNQAFVEAYMVGANHEMGRELLWHQVPTDLGATFFRQFWDVRGRVAPAQAADGAFDIRPINRWGRRDLGDNSSRDPPEALVVLVRGDIVAGHPRVVVYLAEADVAVEPPKPSPTEAYPLFRAALGSDVGAWGFELTPAKARGDGSPSSPGWYVILQEPPAEPRFGLPPELSPEEPVPGTPLPRPGGFLRRGEPLFRAAVGEGAAVSSALVAKMLYRTPVRVAFRAATMLPVDAQEPHAKTP